MPRQKRVDKGNIVYHALNRANGRLRIFKKRGDFAAFEQILAEGLARFEMRLCGYCIMGIHWHLVLWPRRDGDLSQFMKWTPLRTRTAGTPHTIRSALAIFTKGGTKAFLCRMACIIER